MSQACDPAGKCPRCGYQNGAGQNRCVRCHSVIVVPRGCTGACTKCLMNQTFSADSPSTKKEG